MQVLKSLFYEMKKIEVVGIVPVKANSERVKKEKLTDNLVTQTYLNLSLKQLQKTKSFKYISSFLLKIRRYYLLLNKRVSELICETLTTQQVCVPMSEVYSYIGSASIKRRSMLLGLM